MMRNILILGAGKSATVLIDYLLDHADELNCTVTIGDLNVQLAEDKINGHPLGKSVYFNSEDDACRIQCIAAADIVISLLPPFLHPLVAKDCVKLKKHFVSASYVSEEMEALDKAAREAGVILLNEMGLDPGIDHMSAMRMISHVQAQGACVDSFESYTGGLIAPESDNNPWNYKFTWNPRNVVLAGQGTAKFLQNHAYKYIPYQQLFARYDILDIPEIGEFEGYPNRDSLNYREAYGLTEAATIVRGTLRKRGFCDAWNVFVLLGMTDDSYVMEKAHQLTWKEYTLSFIPGVSDNVKQALATYLGISNQSILQKLEWLGLFENELIFEETETEIHYSPAQILQRLLERKLKLNPGDKDMCVMMHIMEFSLNHKNYRMESSMVAIGTDEIYTAMAKTVGLPAAIAAKMILNGDIKLRGVAIPVTPEIYMPILNELAETHGIVFNESIAVIE